MQHHTARFLAGAADAARLPKPEYPEIAFAGRSNVGKSSLLNRLVGQHGLARVSKTPGRTQQINFFLIDDRVVFVDLPGYGFARVPLEVKARWKGLVEGYLNDRRSLRAVVVLVDLRRGIGEEDTALLAYLQGNGIASIIAATKADKLARGERTLRARELVATAGRSAECVVTSASTGDGIETLWDAIAARLGRQS